MSIQSQMAVYQGDTFLSPVWAVVIGGAPVDLAAGWNVAAQARRNGVVVADWTQGSESPGAGVVLGSAMVKVGSSQVVTSTLRLYLSPSATEVLPAGNYRTDIEISHPTKGPLGDLYRVTLVNARIAVTADVTEEG